MANINVIIKNVELRDDGKYSFTIQTPNGSDYGIYLTSAQCQNITTVTTAIQNIAQPKKYVNQEITISI